jgi:hypothetical protein
VTRSFLLLLVACATPDPDGQADPGEYDDGVYHCCADGDGTACCDGYEQGMCFQYGGVYEGCVPAGGEIEGKVICALCCDGLVEREPMVETTQVFDGYPEGCGPGPAPPSILVCVACGDGVCGEGENRCVCPEDCP